MRILTFIATTLAALAFIAGAAFAHPLNPPSGGNDAAPGGLPMGSDNPGHNGVQCAAEHGSPVFLT